MTDATTNSTHAESEADASLVSFRTVRHLLEMIRFSHTVFALPFAMLAAVMAWRLNTISDPSIAFRWQDLVGILLCMVLARSAAMAFNRLVDADIDAANPRTAERHLPSGKLSKAGVIAFATACTIGFVLATLLFLPNWLPLYLSTPVLLFLAGYSYTKRFTWLSHAWLGAALMLAPVCAWIALRGTAVIESPIDLLPAAILGIAVLLWVTGFDIIYACQDLDFDRESGLKSIPARFGAAGALRIAAILHAGMLATLAGLPFAYPQFGWLFWCAWLAVAVLLIYEHTIVRPNELTRVNVAFFQINAILSIGLFVVGTVDVLWT